MAIKFNATPIRHRAIPVRWSPRLLAQRYNSESSLLAGLLSKEMLRSWLQLDQSDATTSLENRFRLSVPECSRWNHTIYRLTFALLLTALALLLDVACSQSQSDVTARRLKISIVVWVATAIQFAIACAVWKKIHLVAAARASTKQPVFTMRTSACTYARVCACT